VIKKSTVIVPKVGGQYSNLTSHANQITINQSPSVEQYSEGRSEDLESSNYLMQMNACSSHNMGSETSLNINGGIRDHGNWSQSSYDLGPFLSPPTSSFSNYGAITYPPSKVVHNKFHFVYILKIIDQYEKKKKRKERGWTKNLRFKWEDDLRKKKEG
jgi:hypothetical protein